MGSALHNMVVDINVVEFYFLAIVQTDSLRILILPY